MYYVCFSICILVKKAYFACNVFPYIFNRTDNTVSSPASPFWANYYKIIESCRIMKIMSGGKEKCSVHHLYNKLVAESGISALTMELRYNFIV